MRMLNKYPESAKSYGLGPIPLSKVMLKKDAADLALSRNAVFHGLFGMLKSGQLTEQNYRSWCDRFWTCKSEAEVEALARVFSGVANPDELTVKQQTPLRDQADNERTK